MENVTLNFNKCSIIRKDMVTGSESYLAGNGKFFVIHKQSLS